MKNYEPVMSFGEDVAEMYGNVQRGDEAAAVAFLAKLAGRGPALELAVGAGRIALPLAAQGIRVDGVDISPAMVAQLSGKPSPPAERTPTDWSHHARTDRSGPDLPLP